MTTEYTVLTPAGQFTATWAEDDDVPVAYTGSSGGIAYFRQFMAATLASGHGGLPLDVDRLEPSDLFGFCQSKEYGILVLPDAEDMRSYLEAEMDEDDPEPVLDSAGGTGSIQQAKAALAAAASPLDRIKAARVLAELLRDPLANANVSATGNDPGAETTSMLPTDSKYLKRAQAAYAAGFTTDKAKKDALSDLNWAYEAIRDAVQWLYLDIPHDQRTEGQGEVYDSLPYNVHQFRQKHVDLIVREFPQAKVQAEQMLALAALRESWKDAEVTRVPTKAAVERERVEAAKGSMDPSVNEIIAKLDVLKPGVAQDFVDYVTKVVARLLLKYGTRYDLRMQVVKRGPDADDYARFGRYIKFTGNGSDSDRTSGPDSAAIEAASVRYAEGQINAFKHKLARKIGNLSEAVVHDLSASGFTFSISGKLGDRSVRVRQQRIINQSKNGEMFHQWPALIRVDGKALSEAQYRKLSEQPE